MRTPFYFQRFLAVLLSVGLAAPSPALALRQDSGQALRQVETVEAGLESKLEAALTADPTPHNSPSAIRVQPPAVGLEQDASRPLRVKFLVLPGQKVEATLPTGERVQFYIKERGTNRRRVVIPQPAQYITYRERSLQPGAVWNYTLYKTIHKILPLKRRGNQGYERRVDEGVYFFPISLVEKLLEQNAPPEVWRTEAPYVFWERGRNSDGSVEVEMHYREPAVSATSVIQEGATIADQYQMPMPVAQEPQDHQPAAAGLEAKPVDKEVKDLLSDLLRLKGGTTDQELELLANRLPGLSLSRKVDFFRSLIWLRDSHDILISPLIEAILLGSKESARAIRDALFLAVEGDSTGEVLYALKSSLASTPPALLRRIETSLQGESMKESVSVSLARVPIQIGFWVSLVDYQSSRNEILNQMGKFPTAAAYKQAARLFEKAAELINSPASVTALIHQFPSRTVEIEQMFADLSRRVAEEVRSHDPTNRRSAAEVYRKLKEALTLGSNPTENPIITLDRLLRLRGLEEIYTDFLKAPSASSLEAFKHQMEVVGVEELAEHVRLLSRDQLQILGLGEFAAGLEGRAALRHFLAHPDVEGDLTYYVDGDRVVDLHHYFPELPEGEALLVPTVLLPSAPLDMKYLKVFVQDDWKEMVEKNFAAQPWAVEIADKIDDSVDVVIGDSEFQKILQQKFLGSWPWAFLEVDSKEVAKRITLALLANLESHGLLRSGTVLVLEKVLIDWKSQEVILIFA